MVLKILKESQMKQSLIELLEWFLKPAKKDKNITNRIPMDSFGVPIGIIHNRHHRRALASLERRHNNRRRV